MLRAIVVDAASRVHVANGIRICTFDAQGKLLSAWTGEEGNPRGRLRFALGLAVDSAGNIYVADVDDKTVREFELK
jgi:DNA-binding beta-propeller fold protein YncE